MASVLFNCYSLPFGDVEDFSEEEDFEVYGDFEWEEPYTKRDAEVPLPDLIVSHQENRHPNSQEDSASETLNSEFEQRMNERNESYLQLPPLEIIPNSVGGHCPNPRNDRTCHCDYIVRNHIRATRFQTRRFGARRDMHEILWGIEHHEGNKSCSNSCLYISQRKAETIFENSKHIGTALRRLAERMESSTKIYDHQHNFLCFLQSSTTRKMSAMLTVTFFSLVFIKAIKNCLTD